VKRFVKTLPGKVLIFILCVLLLCVAVGTSIGIVFMVEQGVYSRSQSSTLENTITGRMINEVYYRLIYSWYQQSEVTDGIELTDEISNIVIRVTDESGKVILADADYDTLAGDYRNEYSLYCIRYQDGGLTFSFDSWGEATQSEYWEYENSDESMVDVEIAELIESPASQCTLCTVQTALRKILVVQDSYYYLIQIIYFAYHMRIAVFFVAAAAFLLALVLYVVLISVSGRRPDKQELYPGPMNKVPFDLLAVISISALIFFVIALWDSTVATLYRIIIMGVAVLLFSALFVGLSMSLAARVKQGSLLKKSVLGYLFRGIKILLGILWHGVTRLPLVWQTVTGIVLISIVELFMLVGFCNDGVLVLLWLIEKLILVPLVLYIAMALRRLERGGEALVNGDYSYQTDTKHLHLRLKQHALNLNQAADGMSHAVDERMKSERMKTELITNVSHDLKTPLTSILNYSRLIEQEPCDNPKVTEYAGVLSHQSARLKRLIEDLVEASKASTGNLDVSMEPCNAAVLLTQAAGEFEDKLAENGLTMVISVPEEPVTIMADGRRLWRVFDNLLNNARKYALAGTRVYLNLERVGHRAVITIKNVSREPLNISADELMERFVRGDSSRNTEGNGLGLSIARSLTELQNGTLDLIVDGDLFKAVLSFLVIESE